MLSVGSLFSGIGGIDLGLERAGMRVVWQCEQDAWCRGILARHWPGVPCYDDVRSIVAYPDGGQPQQRSDGDDRGGALAASGQAGLGASGRDQGRVVSVRVPRVDVLAGGFPCQPVSLAGKGLAQADARWLWPEFARLIRVLRPRYVIAENVPGLLTRGLDIVLADLAALRFDAEWTVFGARDVGAPHKRDRVWIVAWDRLHERPAQQPEPPRRGSYVADPEGTRERTGLRESEPGGIGRRRPSDSDRPRYAWSPEPDVGRVAHGVPHRVDRLRALGNAVVPACADHIGRLVIQLHNARQGATTPVPHPTEEDK